MARTVLIETQYFPPVAYFASLVNADQVILERCEHYQKQTYRNRCEILTSQGSRTLIVPLTGKHGKTLISEVKIDYSQKWLNGHWRAIQSAYGKAPFFEHYADDIHQLLFRKTERLFDLNHQVLTMCLKWLKWKLPVLESQTYEKSGDSGVNDLRSAISPKTRERMITFYRPVPYQQVFGSMFVQHLSLLDVILCTGPDAGNIVAASVKE